ncbi:recombinase family protein [Kitasatospora viridis]|uniref:DNA invertase Pin-like site-specific DNA recombinase n=1 Tax=Kitasatospora viridis TaxID=281105 RepID=A0A561UPI1_9ACTN|nr:recombinase family protein [Kitasatospora viridis]TWG01259.1 DNA invertase Pin-like site-specific DNA recombinase [Kitasatospora viridis]
MPVPTPGSESAERAAAYCWPSRPTSGGRPDHRDALDTQVRQAREQAAALGLSLGAQHVFTDTRPPNSPEEAPGWTALLTALRRGEAKHLLLPDGARLDRLPCAFAELLALAEEQRIHLHGHPADLNDPAVRTAALRRAERACQAARQASTRARKAHRQAAAEGRTHGGGLRRFGYAPGMTEVIEAEAEVVRELFARFLAGDSLRSLALDLNDRQIPTAYGNRWTVSGVGRLIEAPRYAGLRVQDGGVVRTADGGYVTADWPPCVSVQEWEAAQQVRADRAQAQEAGRRPRRDYPLTSLLRCTRCERHMVGSAIGGYPTYACTSNSSLEAEHCSRHIAAESLESHVAERAIALLEALDEPALDGVPVGEAARFGWSRLSPTRRAAVFRHFFSCIRIGPSSTSRSVFDPTRIELLPRRPFTD